MACTLAPWSVSASEYFLCGSKLLGGTTPKYCAEPSIGERKVCLCVLPLATTTPRSTVRRYENPSESDSTRTPTVTCVPGGGSGPFGVSSKASCVTEPAGSEGYAVVVAVKRLSS